MPARSSCEAAGRRGSGSTSIARELGLDFVAVSAGPRPLRTLRQPRVGLYRSWTANMDEGWTRFVLNQYEFTVETLRDADMRGDLSDFDVIILPDQSPMSIMRGHAGPHAARLRGGIGAEGVAALRRFVDGGGRIVAFDKAGDFAIEQLELPVRNAVAASAATSCTSPDRCCAWRGPLAPPAFGMQRDGVAFFQESRGFEPTADNARWMSWRATVSVTCCSAAGRSARSSTSRPARRRARAPRRGATSYSSDSGRSSARGRPARTS
jgi:hypothetical protein